MLKLDRYSPPSKLNAAICRKNYTSITTDEPTPGSTDIIEPIESSKMGKWTKIRDLGQGAYGSVWLEEAQSEVRAVKRVSGKENMFNRRELNALEELKTHSQYFVQFYDSWSDESNVYLAMEYIQHGDLMGIICQENILENDIKSITTQLLKGLEIMHSKGFCHRDLKPQNILVASMDPITIKIADFGVTKKFSDGTQLRTLVGTFGFIAPEVLGFHDKEISGYTSSADIWSLGSVVHCMFTNTVPFPENRQLIDYVRGINAQFPKEKLLQRGVSLDAICFIESLMKPYPEKRLMAKQALEAPWLRIDKNSRSQLFGKPQPSIIVHITQYEFSGIGLSSMLRLQLDTSSRSLKMDRYNAQEEGFQDTYPPGKIRTLKLRYKCSPIRRGHARPSCITQLSHQATVISPYGETISFIANSYIQWTIDLNRYGHHKISLKADLKKPHNAVLGAGKTISAFTRKRFPRRSIKGLS